MKFIPFSVSLFAGALVASAQTPPASPEAGAASRPPDSGDPVARLDALVVTGSLDNKTAFDLAQGASILASRDLKTRRQSSLGDTLDGLPGVASTSYGPGSGRPVIRGFSGDRVRVLSEGLGSQDLSTLSPDHAVTVEPFLAERIEVLRGPSTLLYGNSAVGGVVNVLDGRIPLHEQADFLRSEARWDSNSRGRTGVFSGGHSTGGSSVRVQGVLNRSDDIQVPGLSGRLEGTSINAKSGSVGFGLHDENTNVGIAVGQQESFYGVPVDEPIAIDLRQRKLDLAGEQKLGGWFTELRGRFSVSDYRHFERDREGEREIHTELTQRGSEGRLELQQDQHGAFSGLSGIQFSTTKVGSAGEEVVTPPFRQTQWALFTLQEWSRPGWSVQAGARAEHQSLRLGEVPDDLPAVPGYAATSGETRSGLSPSASLGVVWYPDKDTSAALSLSATERLPLGQELFANGPHGGTGNYEVGRNDLPREKSVGAEFSLRRRAGDVTGSVGVFVQEFDHYLYEQRINDDAIPADRNEEGLPVYQYASAAARFVGGEAELAFHLLEQQDRSLHLEVSADVVRATNLDTSEPLPRITPVRLIAKLTYEQGPWQFGLVARQVLRQSRVAADESATAGYLLLGVEGSWSHAVGRHRFEIFVRGQNLGDRLARVHTSFLKDVAPLPGRGVVAGLRYEF